MTSSHSILLCPACMGQNAPDSKFCRHCGHALSGAAVADAAPVAAAPVATAPVATAPVAIASEPLSFSGEIEMPDDVLPGMAEDAVMSSPAEIDARRAKHSLERAQGLAERGDTAGAILACRQALVLAPAVAGGQAMLGALLERTGDLTHAVQAFEKAVQAAPESGAARDLARLRDKLGVPPENAPVFHFDDAELFGNDSPATPENAPTTAPTTAPVAAPATNLEPVPAPAEAAAATADAFPTEAATESVTAQSGIAPEGASVLNGEAAVGAVSAAEAAGPAAGLTAAPVVIVMNELSDAAPAGIAPVAAMPDPVAAIPVAIPVAAPVNERRVAVVPVRVERRVSAVVAPSALGTPLGARVQAPIAARAINPALLAESARQPQGLSALWARPSFFTRSLPLVGATILSLGFLSWARGLADARNLAGSSTLVVAQTQTVTPPAPAPATGSSNLPALAPVGSAAPATGGFPITNQPLSSPVTTPPLTASAAPPTASAARPVLPAQPAPRRVARPLPSLAPAPISSLGPVRTGAPRSPDGGSLTLPPPVISQPDPGPAPQSVLPPGDAGALNPAGSPGSGYVRITRGRIGSLLPQRPAGRASDAERGAAAAARGGSTGQAIDGLTAAINANASDAGYRFQQRAMLFLGQSDYARAVDDFQSSIAAYQDQIARGEQVASARAGLSAARSGLNRALAGGR